jgi:hypothetical protein
MVYSSVSDLSRPLADRRLELTFYNSMRVIVHVLRNKLKNKNKKMIVA